MEMNKGILVLVIAILVGSSVVGVVSAAHDSIYLVVDGDPVTLYSLGCPYDVSAYLINDIHHVYLKVPDTYGDVDRIDVVFESVSEAGTHSVYDIHPSGIPKRISGTETDPFVSKFEKTWHLKVGACWTHLKILGNSDTAVFKVRAYSTEGVTTSVPKPEELKPEPKVAPEPDMTAVEVFIQNDDDDEHKVELRIDNKHVASPTIRAGNYDWVDDYQLSSNEEHTYEIVWVDDDDNVYKHTEKTVTSKHKVDLVIPRIERTASWAYKESEDTLAPKPKPTPELVPKTVTTTVYVYNDNDYSVTAKLHVWGGLQKEKGLSANSGNYFGDYEVSADKTDTFSVLWHDCNVNIDVWTDVAGYKPAGYGRFETYIVLKGEDKPTPAPTPVPEKHSEFRMEYPGTITVREGEATLENIVFSCDTGDYDNIRVTGLCSIENGDIASVNGGRQDVVDTNVDCASTSAVILRIAGIKEGTTEMSIHMGDGKTSYTKNIQIIVESKLTEKQKAIQQREWDEQKAKNEKALGIEKEEKPPEEDAGVLHNIGRVLGRTFAAVADFLIGDKSDW